MLDPNQKIENLLNLSLQATPFERSKSPELNVGYDPDTNLRELIIKYSNPLSFIQLETATVVPLLNNYAIITIPDDKVEQLARYPDIEYIEMPKSLYFDVQSSKQSACISPVQSSPLSLTGDGTIVSILDSGIDYLNPAFLNPDKTTRILELWDQTKVGSPPEGYAIGTLYTRSQLNTAIKENDPTLSVDTSGHGTQVAGIAVGNQGIASGAELIIVKLGNPLDGGFPKTTEVLQGIDYSLKRALSLNKPIVMNLSFGNNYGSHDGSSLLETYINNASNFWKSSICIGTGNEGSSAGHTSGILQSDIETSVELAISNREAVLNLQVWKYYEDEIELSLLAPSGEEIGPFPSQIEVQRYISENTQLLVYYGMPTPFSLMQEIYIDFIPLSTYIDSGIWTVQLTPKKLVTGQYDMWLPSSKTLSSQTNFLKSTPQNTLTIPSTASQAISIGAYNNQTFSYADFSGRGSNSNPRLVKPDLVAPGVDIQTTTVGGGTAIVSGTSFSTPFVSGSAALLMEWGIVDGNDAFLYGEKLKAYLRSGAQKLPGYQTYPNIELGYGTLCLEKSFP